MQLRDDGGKRASDTALILGTVILSIAAAAIVPSLEFAGHHIPSLLYLMALFPLLLGVVLPMLSRFFVRHADHSAEPSVSPLLSGMALGASSLPASLIVMLAGLLFLEGQDALVYGTGLMSGMVVATSLMAQRFRASGAGTIPKFLKARFGRAVALLGAGALVIICLLLLAAELSIAGLAAERGLGLSYDASIAVFAAVAAVAVLLSGVRGVSALQATLYGLLAAGLVIALLLLAGAVEGLSFAPIFFGETLRDIASGEMQLLEGGLVDLGSFRQHAKPFLNLDELNLVALFVTLMAGTAALPHVVTRFGGAASARSARLAGAWATLFVLVLLVTLPALAAFTKLALFKLIPGTVPLTSVPDWFEPMSRLGLVRFHGVSLGMFEDVLSAVRSGEGDAAGIAAILKSGSSSTLEAWAALEEPIKAALIDAAKAISTASGVEPWDAFKTSVIPAVAALSGNEAGVLSLGGLSVDAGAVLFLVPSLTVTPIATAGLILAAVLAAALATTIGIAAVLSNAISGSIGGVRAIAVAVIAAAALAALMRPGPMLLVLAAFSISAASLFPVLALGLWWPRASAWGAGIGMTAGLLLTTYYLVGTQLFPAYFYDMWADLSNASEMTVETFSDLKAALESAQTEEAKSAAALALESFARGGELSGGPANWFGVRSGAAALFGLPFSFVVMVLVSVLAPRDHRGDSSKL